MDLFGVQDLGSSKASIGPGYAYVPDLGPTPSSTGLTKKRKAAEHRVTGTAAEHSSAQNAKIMRELAELDKDSYRDAQIPVPSGRGMLSATDAH